MFAMLPQVDTPRTTGELQDQRIRGLHKDVDYLKSLKVGPGLQMQRGMISLSSEQTPGFWAQILSSTTDASGTAIYTVQRVLKAADGSSGWQLSSDSQVTAYDAVNVGQGSNSVINDGAIEWIRPIYTNSGVEYWFTSGGGSSNSFWAQITGAGQWWHEPSNSGFWLYDWVKLADSSSPAIPAVPSVTGSQTDNRFASNIVDTVDLSGGQSYPKVPIGTIVRMYEYPNYPYFWFNYYYTQGLIPDITASTPTIAPSGTWAITSGSYDVSPAASGGVLLQLCTIPVYDTVNGKLIAYPITVKIDEHGFVFLVSIASSPTVIFTAEECT